MAPDIWNFESAIINPALAEGSPTFLMVWKLGPQDTIRPQKRSAKHDVVRMSSLLYGSGNVVDFHILAVFVHQNIVCNLRRTLGLLPHGTVTASRGSLMFSLHKSGKGGNRSGSSCSTTLSGAKHRMELDTMLNSRIDNKFMPRQLRKGAQMSAN